MIMMNNKRPKPRRKQPKEVIFVRGISRTVKEKFKELCERENVSMSQMTARLIKEAVSEEEE